MIKTNEILIQDVLDVKVFDENGNFIGEIDKATEVSFCTYSDGRNMTGELIVNSFLFNLNLLAATAGVEVSSPNELSDFDKEKLPQAKIIKIKDEHNTKEFKIVARGIAYDLDSGEVKTDLQISVGKAVWDNRTYLPFAVASPLSQKLRFTLLSDEDGNLAEIKVTERN